MKRLFLLICIFCFAVSVNAYSMNYMVGVKSGYFVWEPYIKELKGGGISDIDKGSGVLYGPVISVMFTPDLSFSIAGLYGEQSAHWSSPNTATTWDSQPDAVIDVSGLYTVDITRIDIDSALSYRLTGNFKIFAGYKYQRIEALMKIEERRFAVINSTDNVLYESEWEYITPAQGPALGVGFSIPFGGSFFLSSNFSFIYMWSSFKVTEVRTRSYDVGTYGDLDYANSEYTVSKDVWDFDSRQAGINFEPSIGAVVGDTGVIFNVSARIQYMRIEFVDEMEAAPGGWVTDLFYGAYVSVLYTF